MKAMTPHTALPKSQIIEFTTQTQIQLFTRFKQSRFSGKLVLTDRQDEKWIFYFYLGRFLYATGGEHRHRRWQRSLLAHCPEMYFLSLQQDMLQDKSVDGNPYLRCLSPNICWEYQVLCHWVTEGKITHDQALKVIGFVLTETLFDVHYERRVAYRVVPDKSLSAQLIFSDTGRVIREVHEQWLAWQQAKLMDRSPNLALVMQKPEAFQAHFPDHVYQKLIPSLDGQHTLRDIALTMKRDLTAVTAFLLPYVQLGLLSFRHIPDLPGFDLPDTLDREPCQHQSCHDALVACVDDSSTICQTMNNIIHEAGYRYISVNDPLRAIAILLANKPDIIFLDLVMPNINGYEICSQLRRLSFFKHTPIVILTGNDGIVDRVRAKLVGASDFISKPVDRTTVLCMVQKYVHFQRSS